MCTEQIQEIEQGKLGVGEPTNLKVKALWRSQTIMRKMEMLTICGRGQVTQEKGQTDEY